MLKQPLLRLVPTGADFSASVAPLRRTKVAIVIPCYNEERNIEKVLLEINALRLARPDWEVLPVIVDDGSTDGTAELLNRIAFRYGAAVLSMPINVGIGGAVQAGFRYAVKWGADVSLQLDGDGQHPASEVPAIVDPLLSHKADVIVGSRYLPGASGNVSTNLRFAGTWCFSRLLQLLLGIRIHDTTSGFRAFNADASDFIARYYPDDYPEVEAYVPLARRGFQILEVPVRMRPRNGGSSSITPLRSVYYMIKVAFATVMDVFRPLPPRRSISRTPDQSMEGGEIG